MAKEGRTPGLKSSKRYEPDRHWLRQFINSPDPNQTFERLLAEPNSEGSSSPRNHIQKSLAEFDASFFGEPANNQVQSSQTRTVLQASTPLLQRSPLAPSPETVKLNVVTVSVPPAVALLGNVDDQYGSQSTTKPLGQESETHFKPLTTRTKEHTTVDVETADTASGPRITAGSTQNVTHMIKTEATEKFGPTVSPVPATIAALEVVDSSRLSPNPILRSPDKEDGSINKAEFPTISTESLVPRPSDNKRTSYSQIPKRPNANQVTRASDMTAQSTSKYAIRQASPTMQKNRELVVALIAYVTELLRSKSSDLDVPTVTQAEKTTTNLASSPSKPASSRGQPDVTKDLRSKGYRGTSKKRKTQISSEDEDASDSCGQEKPVLTSRKGKETMKRRFACPYFKHNPAKYGGRRYCCGPGWPDIHRLKFVQKIRSSHQTCLTM
ncbi:hypothetical protein BKA67DRAFT_180520 [Truncatella angustata]|uniref:Uncharacterized protein n=1 Tax=Truncatella angustata TaxID=152316 RepID=A0A9P9A0J1_9PEZI|nr:uncharacterized protein BKA67DRAFT_180520 [Truncatella angustata]KAH6657139.1 hypothetical protein BKA67DRAFT_180520 [Truncatella angustata]